MRIWGHYESVKIQGSDRTAEVYIPTWLNYACLPVLFFALPFAVVFSSKESLESAINSPLVFLFFLVSFILGLMSLYGIHLRIRDQKRVLNGELVARTGELYIVSRIHVSKSFFHYRFAIRNYKMKSGFYEVIYEMPQMLYNKFVDQCSSTGRSLSVCPAYQVEFAILPPLDVPEYRCWDATSKLRKSAQSSVYGNLESYAKLPISCSEVVDIFYIKELPYICKTGNDFLFSRI